MTLGLFPLNLVLFPGSQIPLHIYEPRYRTLIGECERSTSTFGINLIESGELHPVGCMASVTEIRQRYSDGRLDIIVQGQQRYKVLNVVETTKPYAVVQIELLVDEPIPTDTLLVDECTDLYNQIVDLVFGSNARTIAPIERTSPTPSFLMAPKSGLSTEQKQTLLELTSENDRLELLLSHLKDVVPTIRKAEQIQKIVQSDGYFTPRAH